MKKWVIWLIAHVRDSTPDQEHLATELGMAYGCDPELSKEIAQDILGLVARVWSDGEHFGWSRERLTTERRGM